VRRMLLVLTAAMVMALVVVAMALPVFAGGRDDDEENDNESGGSTRNGQIVFRRYFDPEQTKGALFMMNPDGSHVRQITHPPRVGGTTYRRGLLMERGSPSSASRSTRARAES
jgi:hypothetical protein